MNPGDLIVPNNQPTKKGIPKLIPVSHELAGAAALITKNAALTLVKPKFFTIDTTRMTDEQSANQPGVGIYNYDKISIFGLPIFDTIKFEAISYTDFENIQQNVGELVLEIALFEIDLPRNIIRTRVTGRNGTIKEYMSDDDYEIKITGSLVNELANIPPEQLIRSLLKIVKSQIEVPVSCTILSYYDIFNIVITHAKFIQRAGYRNVFDFELQCISETPFEIKTNNA